MKFFINFCTASLSNVRAQVNSGVIVCGRTACGKSTVIKSFQNALCVLRSLDRTVSSGDVIQTLNSHYLCPELYTHEQLFGCLVGTGNQATWKPGILSQILTSNGSYEKDPLVRDLICFDGNLSSCFIESLHGFLDDDRLLHLPNGSKIILDPGIRFIFECTSLENCCPSIIHRCGLLLLHQNDQFVSWENILSLWLKQKTSAWCGPDIADLIKQLKLATVLNHT